MGKRSPAQDAPSKAFPSTHAWFLALSADFTLAGGSGGVLPHSPSDLALHHHQKHSSARGNRLAPISRYTTAWLVTQGFCIAHALCQQTRTNPTPIAARGHFYSLLGLPRVLWCFFLSAPPCPSTPFHIHKACKDTWPLAGLSSRKPIQAQFPGAPSPLCSWSAELHPTVKTRPQHRTWWQPLA